MNHLRELELTSVVNFKHTKVKLDGSNITWVRGSNKDSPNPTGNGAGKSQMFNSIPNLAFGAPPLSIKKRGKKELLGRKSSIRLVNQAPDGHVYDVTQFASKYIILRDGEDLGLRTVPLAEAFIREHVYPLSDIDYYTYCHVSTQKPYKMQTDSNIDRLKTFSQLFRLEDFDRLKRHFLKKVGAVAEYELKLGVLERELLSAKAKLKRASKAVEEAADVDQLKSNKKSLEAEVKKLEEQVFETKTMLSSLQTLQQIETELDELRTRYKAKEPPSKRAAYLREQRKLVRADEKYKSLLAAYKRSVRDATEKLDAIKLPKTAVKELKVQEEDIDARIDKSETLLETMQKAEAARDEAAHEATRLHAKLEKLGFSSTKKPDLKADYSTKIAECRTTLQLQRLLDHTHGGGADEGFCPTCRSDLDMKSIRKMVRRAEEALPVLEASQKAQTVYREWKSSHKLALVAADAYDGEKHSALTERLESLRSDQKRLSKDLGLWDEYNKLKKIIASIEAPSKPEQQAEVSMSADALDSEIELCEEVSKHLEARNRMIQADDNMSGLRTVAAVKSKVKEGTRLLESLKEKLIKANKKLATTISALDAISSAANERRIYQDQVDEIQKKIAKYQPHVADKRVFEVLAKAYSDKGLKTSVAADICSLLEQNLNAYAPLIFMEPFLFSIEVSKSGMAILVDRGNDKISDVRSLSGAESNCFRLLFLFSLLPLIPDARRLNMLILDEPCNHQDEGPREKFLQIFLPALAEVVPHIYIITPNATDTCDGSVDWIVEKKKGSSKVITRPLKTDEIPNSAFAHKMLKQARARRKIKRKKAA